jgi:hypothetical protein
VTPAVPSGAPAVARSLLQAPSPQESLAAVVEDAHRAVAITVDPADREALVGVPPLEHLCQKRVDAAATARPGGVEDEEDGALAASPEDLDRARAIPRSLTTLPLPMKPREERQGRGTRPLPARAPGRVTTTVAPARFPDRFRSPQAGKGSLSMATELLLRGPESPPVDRCGLDERGEEMLAAAARELIAYTTSRENGAIALERDGEIVAVWSHEGALRLAQLVPPAFAELASAILQRHQSE